MKIKICGLQQHEQARQAAQLGAHFIGLIFEPASRRYVNIEQAQHIAHAAKEAGAIPVAVFTNHTAEIMLEICRKTQINTVQLHGNLSRKEHCLLPNSYQRIYVRTVRPNGKVNRDQENGLDDCEPERDFLLFDNEKGGKGIPFDWTGFHYHGSYRMFLAGGLTVENVNEAIQIVKPSGIDVSSGVENKAGEKDIKLIEAFMREIQ